MFILARNNMSVKRKHAESSKPIESAEDAFQLYTAGRSSSIDPVIQLFIELKKTEGHSMEFSSRSSRVTLALPTFTNEHIQELLFESRDILSKNGMHVRIPPCIEGSKCLGLDSRIPGVCHGIPQPLSIWMTPSEYANVLEHGMIPKERRMCALCVAHSTSFHYLRWRLMKPQSDDEVVIANDAQPFCIRVDEPGGFHSKFCIPFRRDSSHSIIAPMILPQLFLLENKYNANGVRYVCQRRLTHEFSIDTMQYF